MSNYAFGNLGENVGDISVVISYRIIDLFSRHLYSSPNKAIEEIVTNSYDAFAKNCIISIPEPLDEDSAIYIFDDGDGMDLEGLKELWLIADTKKREKNREDESQKRGRLPVGKFGIGKLASYVISKKITHITKKDGNIYAVTMDYSIIEEDFYKSDEYYNTNLKLPIKKLVNEDIEELVSKLDNEEITSKINDDHVDSWTLVIMGELKESAYNIRLGVLRYVISTALPLIPDFQCFLNGSEVPSKRLEDEKIHTWIIGKDDETAKKIGYETGYDKSISPYFDYYVNIPDSGPVGGIVELYEDTITKGKAAEYGRSHGFFIMVRGRLINTHEAEFGLTNLQFQTFYRMRMVIYADFLDKFIVLNREDVEEIGKSILENYLNSKYLEIRDYYGNYISAVEKQWPDSVDELPESLTRYPITNALDRIEAEDITPISIKRPSPNAPVIERIQKVEVKTLGPEAPVAVLDVETGTISGNRGHPFTESFKDDKGFMNWAIAEAFLEIYMLEAGIQYNVIRDILEKRDKLLRVLVRQGPRSAETVAEMLRHTTHLEKPFEIACSDALDMIGFDVEVMGSTGFPEGIAKANLGVDSEGNKLDYSFVYDAKTSTGPRVKTANINMGSTDTHRKRHKTDYALIIAKDYQGDTDEDSQALQQAKNLKITLMRAEDLARLVLCSAVKCSSLAKLEEIFKAQTPSEVTEKVDKIVSEKPQIPPIRIILDTIYDIQVNDQVQAPTFHSVRERRIDELRTYHARNVIGTWLLGLQKLVPELIDIHGDTVMIRQRPEKIIDSIVDVVKRFSDPTIAEELLHSLLDTEKTHEPIQTQTE